jgi:methanogenic corrinoid protein MtbC1
MFMVSESLYREYLSFLLEGNKSGCARIVQALITNKIDLEILYIDLFKRSLYEIGDMWTANKVSVATEHLCTAMTEGLMTLAHPLIFSQVNAGKKAVISCVANEYHQIGGKMVADVLELYGWDTYFLGANVPVEHLIVMLDDKKPDLLCLSMSVYFNMNNLDRAIRKVRESYPELPIFVGGKAFEFVTEKVVDPYKNVKLIHSLPDLKYQLLTFGDSRG